LARKSPVHWSTRTVGTSSIETAHRRNIIHRDIKADNILLHDDFALVTDFGVARAIEAAESDTITQTGLTLGTPAYMSPEQSSGSVEIDGRADIYSLGCMLHEMLVGSPPFGRGPTEAVLRRQITEAPRQLREVKPGIPEAVDAAVQRALAKPREERFATAGEFAERLEILRSEFTSGSRIAIAATRERRVGVLLLAVGVLAIAAVAFVAWPRSGAVQLSLTTIAQSYAESLAVLPVENATGLGEIDGLADAVTYDAINSLLDVPELKVSSYISVRRLGSQRPGPREIVDSLGVRLILASQLRESGGAVRLDAQLLDGTTDQVLSRGSWAIDGVITEKVEHGLARRLVELVNEGVGLEDRPERAAALHGPGYESYRLGTHWLGRRTSEGVLRALEYFKQAIRLDSTYAPAFEGLSSAYMLGLGYRYQTGVDGYEAAGRALAAANRAITLDPTYPNGYAARGFVVSRAYGPTEDAARDFGRALRLAPNASQAVSWSATVLWQQGKPDEAFAAIQRGISLAPFSPATHMAAASAAFALGQFDLAAQEARRATELEPALVESRAWEGLGLLLGGRANECLSIAFGPHGAIRAACLHAVGRTREAAAIADSIARAVTDAPDGDYVYTSVPQANALATYYAWIGDHEGALRWIEFAFEQSPRGVDPRVLDSTLFNELRQDPVAARRLEQVTRAIWPRVERHADSVE
jgi:serine/threonine-protein kinase